MGTRSLTVFLDDNHEEIAVMYRQFDGYLSGHGKDLADFLKGKTLVNGIGSSRKVFNGMNCLAASVIAHFKKEPGYFYLYPAGTRDMDEEYVYVITGATGTEPHMQVQDFSGPASDYQVWLNGKDANDD